MGKRSEWSSGKPTSFKRLSEEGNPHCERMMGPKRENRRKRSDKRAEIRVFSSLHPGLDPLTVYENWTD